MIDPDLFATVVDALEAASAELDMLDQGGEWPIPDELQKQLDQRVALLATLARVCEGFEKTNRANIAQSIRAVYTEELAKADARFDMPGAPVDVEVQQEVAGALELVRRARLVDGSVRDALEAVKA